jgi:diguanylate cyclase (GGDEF)-like protein
VAICQYSREKFPAEVLLEVVKTHPLVIYGDMVCRNPYYLPPREYLDKKVLPEEELKRYLHSLKEAEELRLSLEDKVAWRTRELERRTEELTALHTLVSAVNRSLELEEVLHTAVNMLSQVTGMETAWIQLLDQEKDELVLSAYRELSPETVEEVKRLQVGQSITGWVAQRGEIAIVTDLQHDPRLTTGAARREGYHSLAVLPLTARGKILGVIAVATRKKRLPQIADVGLLEALGAELGNAIDRALLHRQVQEAALTDSMTGLRNFRYLQGEAEREFARSRRSKLPLSLLIADVDDLKKVNDRWGHQQGDELLKAVGETLRRSVRAADIVTRYGGDEFVLLLPETDSLSAYHLALRLRENVMALELRYNHEPLRTSVSIGIAAYPAHASNFSELLRRADAALYQSKKRGRNQVSIYSETLQILP